MDIKRLSQVCSKEHIYRIYEAVTVDYKPYDKITRMKCLTQIEKAYQDHELLKSFITDGEFELLKEIYLKGKVKMNFIYHDLFDRFLLESCGDDHIQINPNILEIIKPYLEKEIIRDGYDRYDETIIGLIRYFGVLTYDELFQYLEIYIGDFDEELMYIHLCTSPIINYLFLCPQEDIICCYDLFEDVEEIFNNRYRLENLSMLPEKNQLIEIGRYNMLIHHPDISKAMQIIDEVYDLFPYTQIGLINQMIKNAHLGREFNSITFYWHKLNDEQLKNLELAYLNLPSASNYGLPQIYMLEDDEETECVQEYAHLSEEDANLLYKLYLSLLEYVNKKYDICPHVDQIIGVPIAPEDVHEIRKALVENTHVIESYIHSNSCILNEEEKEMIKYFKYMRIGTFVVVKHEKDHTIFMDNDQFYAVKGAHVNIDEMLEGVELPAFVETLLLPFKGKIIVDGVIQEYPIIIGPGHKKIIYDQMKDSLIHNQLIKYN